MKTLENIFIASPCRADWNEMTGDDRVRTCAACAKQVFNLSELTRAEAEAVIARRNGDLCARYYQRRDGTIMLADCTVGGSGARARSFVPATRSLQVRRTRSCTRDRRRPKPRRSVPRSTRRRPTSRPCPSRMTRRCRRVISSARHANERSVKRTSGESAKEAGRRGRRPHGRPRAVPRRRARGEVMKTLENMRIASPCRADWNEMTGDDRIRTCAACAKQVFNLSEMTRAEAEAVIAEKHGNLCARYYQRADGTIMLADCTVGGSGARARSFVLATALAAGAAYAKLHRGSPPAEATAVGTAIAEVPADEPITWSSHRRSATAAQTDPRLPSPDAARTGIPSNARAARAHGVQSARR